MISPLLNRSNYLVGTSRKHTLFKRLRIVFIVLIALIIPTTQYQKNVAISSEISQPELQFSLFHLAMLQNGDIIFRRAASMGSQMVLEVDENSEYSHTGLIRKTIETISVIHAAPISDGPEKGVKEEPIEKFFAGVPKAAVYRLRDYQPEIADKTVAYAESLIGTTPFDYKFDYRDRSSLYCTELIWAAYLSTGIDLVEDKMVELDLPFLEKGLFILPSTLINSPLLYEVFIINTNTP